MNTTRARSLFRHARAATFALLYFTTVGALPAVAVPLVLPPGAVTINQIDFRGGPASLVGELTIDRDLAGNAGFINVIDTATNSWLVRNLPIFDLLSPYDQATITTRIDLAFTGVPEGTLVPSPVELIIDFDTDPSATQSDVSSHGTFPDFYPVGRVDNAVGGVGPEADVNDRGAAPFLNFLRFFANLQFIDLTYQPNHPNIQAGHNQCAPAAIANSLQFLEDTTPLDVPQPNNPGFGNDGTLVGQLDAKTGRGLGPNRSSLVSTGVWPLDGKLAYLTMNGLAGNAIVKHQGDQFSSTQCIGGMNAGALCTLDSQCPGGTCGAQCIGGMNAGAACLFQSVCPGGVCQRVSNRLDGGANRTFMGMTSSGAGQSVDIDWITSELEHGEDVEIDLNYVQCSFTRSHCSKSTTTVCPSCTGGMNMGAPCTVASQCPGGACTNPICSGGANAGAACAAASVCPGGACIGMCPAGEQCVQFGGFHCNATTSIPCFRACAGGMNDRALCSTNSECPGGTCNGACAGGANHGAACAAQSVCPGGFCLNDAQCPAGEKCIHGRTGCLDNAPCPSGERCIEGGRHYVEVVGTGSILGVPFLLHKSDKVQAGTDRNVCSGGPNKCRPCTADSACPGGTCASDVCGTEDIDFEWISSSRACRGGGNNLASCTVDSQCPGGVCAIRCLGGNNSHALCTADSECPGGVCATLCSGGTNYRALCRSNSACPGGVCATTFAGNSGAVIDQVVSESYIEHDPVRHYTCYETHRPNLNIEGVSLIDQFGVSTATIKKAKRLCAPADKAGEDPTAIADPQHLNFYTIKQTTPKFTRIRGVTVNNQFGPHTVDVIKPDRLLVPTAKSLVGPPSPLTDPGDHYKCYKVKGKFNLAGIPVETQFGPVTVDIRKPQHLCAPVDKNGEGIIDPVTHLMCYKVRAPKPLLPESVYIDNQFGPDYDFALFGVRELCVPSTKTLPILTPTPTRTVTATPTRTATPTPTPTPTVTPPPLACPAAPQLNNWNGLANDQSDNNCYNYSTNMKTDTFAQPGRASGNLYTQHVCTNVRDAAVSDGLVFLSNPPNTDPIPTCPGGQCLVALVIDPSPLTCAGGPNMGMPCTDDSDCRTAPADTFRCLDGDYHWYRLNGDGTWSHKPGETEATTDDESSNAITDPRTADRDGYTDFCGFMCVTGSSVVNNPPPTAHQGAVSPLPPPNEVEASVLYYSGRENPGWTITSSPEIAEINCRLNAAITAGPIADPNWEGRLNFAGVKLVAGSATGLPDDLTTFLGDIEVNDAGSTTYYDDVMQLGEMLRCGAITEGYATLVPSGSCGVLPACP